MIVEFTKVYNTKRYRIFMPTSIADVGDFSKIYVRNNSELVDEEERLVLLTESEYEDLLAIVEGINYE